MTTGMNGAAVAVAATERDLRQIVNSGEQLGEQAARSFGGVQAGDALSLYRIFHGAAENKKHDEEVSAANDMLVRQMLAAQDEQARKDKEAQQLAQYQATMERMLAETRDAVHHLDDAVDRLDKKHQDNGIYAADGKEMVLSDDGKHILYADGTRVEKKEDLENYEAQAKEQGWKVETLSEHRRIEKELEDGRKASADANGMISKMEQRQSGSPDEQQQKQNLDEIEKAKAAAEKTQREIEQRTKDCDNRAVASEANVQLTSLDIENAMPPHPAPAVANTAPVQKAAGAPGL